MAMMSCFGFGARKRRERIAWCGWTRNFLERRTYFWPERAVSLAYSKHFQDIEHTEDEWARSRFGATHRLLYVVFDLMLKFVVSKFVGRAIQCSKPILTSARSYRLVGASLRPA